MTKIRASIRVAVPPAEAFRRFTQEVDRCCSQGGRERVRGRVLAWMPPHRLVLGWQVGADGEFAPDLPTELAFSLVAISAKLARASLEYRHLEPCGASAAEQAAVLSAAVGWVAIVEGFARQCSPVATHASKGPNA